MTRPAVFLDRDGTIIVERCYLADPAGVTLLPGAAAALRTLQGAGFALVLITNQSGIARGLFSVEDFRAVQDRLTELLHAELVLLDGEFYCPHHPEYSPPCDCRKPGLGLFRRAASLLDLDLARSIYIGDRISDVAAAASLGGRAFLVRTGYGAEQAASAAAWIEVVDDLSAVARRIAPAP